MIVCERHGGASVTREMVAERLEEACAVWKRLPDKERRFLKAKWGFWPEIILSYYEAYGMSAPKMRMPPPEPSAIDRAYEAMDWMAWLGKEHGRTVMKCVWLCVGEGVKVSTISRTLGAHRETISRKRDFGIAALVLHLAAHKKAS